RRNHSRTEGRRPSRLAGDLRKRAQGAREASESPGEANGDTPSVTFDRTICYGQSGDEKTPRRTLLEISRHGRSGCCASARKERGADPVSGTGGAGRSQAKGSIASMTGFGSAEGVIGTQKYRIEMKSVNHRFL